MAPRTPKTGNRRLLTRNSSQLAAPLAAHFEMSNRLRRDANKKCGSPLDVLNIVIFTMVVVVHKFVHFRRNVRLLIAAITH